MAQTKKLSHKQHEPFYSTAHLPHPPAAQLVSEARASLSRPSRPFTPAATERSGALFLKVNKDTLNRGSAARIARGSGDKLFAIGARFSTNSSTSSNSTNNVTLVLQNADGHELKSNHSIGLNQLSIENELEAYGDDEFESDNDESNSYEPWSAPQSPIKPDTSITNALTLSDHKSHAVPTPPKQSRSSQLTVYSRKHPNIPSKNPETSAVTPIDDTQYDLKKVDNTTVDNDPEWLKLLDILTSLLSQQSDSISIASIREQLDAMNWLRNTSKKRSNSNEALRVIDKRRREKIIDELLKWMHSRSDASIAIACSSLLLKITHNDKILLNACQLLFKLSKKDQNDHLFLKFVLIGMHFHTFVFYVYIWFLIKNFGLF